MKRIRRLLARPFWWLGNAINPHRPYRGGGGYYDACVTFQAATEREAWVIWEEIMERVACERPEGCRMGTGSLKGPFSDEDEEGKVLATTFISQPYLVPTGSNPTQVTYSGDPLYKTGTGELP